MTSPESPEISQIVMCVLIMVTASKSFKFFLIMIFENEKGEKDDVREDEKAEVDAVSEDN